MATSRAPGMVRLGVAALSLVLTSSLTVACAAGTPVVEIVAPEASPGTVAPAAHSGPGDARPADPLSPSSYRPVVRQGRTPHPVVRPVSNNALKAVRYSDGVTVGLDRVAHAIEKGRGPGVLPGRPHTAFSLTLVNHSSLAVDLNQVVVTTMYGSPARLASPVYEDPAARDFSGTVPPGHSATATYVFSVPTDVGGTVLVIVDFDERHVAARLTAGG